MEFTLGVLCGAILTVLVLQYTYIQSIKKRHVVEMLHAISIVERALILLKKKEVDDEDIRYVYDK